MDAALRPTTIKLGQTWTRKAQKSLLAPPTHETLAADAQKDETQRAFDLLDALSRSGALPIDHYITHVFKGVEGTNDAIHALHSGDCLRAVVKYFD